MTAVCLFDGVAGFPLALQRAGIETALSCEIDKAARGVIADHFPNHVLHDDVRTLTADDCRAAGFVDGSGVLTGGFPCQDLSVAGKRAGLSGARSGLFWEIVRLADALHPRWLILENVPGLLSSNGGRDMGAVLGALGDLGYGWAYRVLDAQHFGVPQRRRRVVIVGCLGDRAAPVEVLFEPESVRRDSAPSREAAEDVAGTLGGGSGSRGWAPDTDRMTFIPTVARALMAADSYDRPESGQGNLITHEDGTGRGTPLIPFDLAQITSSTNRSSANPGDPMPTLASGGQPHIADTAVRRLTPTECERLQGFPDNWTATSWGKTQADSPRYRQMGNAIAVPVFEWVARRLAALERAA